ICRYSYMKNYMISYKPIVHFICIVVTSYIFASSSHAQPCNTSPYCKVVKFQTDKVKFNKAHNLVYLYKQKLNSGELPDSTIFPQISTVDFLAEVTRMLDTPNATYLGNNGNYCGPAVIINWLLNNNPENYVKITMELACFGKSLVNGKYELKAPRKICQKIDLSRLFTNAGVTLRNNIDSTSVPDFLLGVSMVNSEKVIQKLGLLFPKAAHKKKSIGSFIFTNTMPWEMDDYFQMVGGCIEEQGYYWGDKESIEQLQIIEQAVENGKLPVVFDNHLISFARGKNFLYKITGAHFITIHSFKVDTANGWVNFTYWDYGSVKHNPYLSIDTTPNLSVSLKKYMRKARKGKLPTPKRKYITIHEFLHAMKGYWIIY
ncbi:MAG: hypothetical protein MI922_22335, partial [Bacteroidales bacterium]|nr:hypothetical protein [Bacteroidales bacterium]